MSDIYKIISGSIIAMETVAIGCLIYKKSIDDTSNKILTEKLKSDKDQLQSEKDDLEKMLTSHHVLTPPQINTWNDIVQIVGCKIEVKSGIIASDTKNESDAYIILQQHSSEIISVDTNYVTMRQDSFGNFSGGQYLCSRKTNQQTESPIYYISTQEFIDRFRHDYITVNNLDYVKKYNTNIQLIFRLSPSLLSNTINDSEKR